LSKAERFNAEDAEVAEKGEKINTEDTEKSGERRNGVRQSKFKGGGNGD
jgi:hypothetical protein